MKIDKHEYQKGKNGVKYGIYNSVTKKFQFNICEDTPMLAKARLFQLIGDDARKWRFDVKRINIQKQECNCYVEQEEIIGWNGPYDAITRTVGRCTGTRELDACSCEGDKSKCDFYKSVRTSVNKSQLTALKDYYFKRDDFEKVWLDVFTKEELGLVLSEGHLVTDNFLYEQIGDEHYLIHLESGTIVNWYKHLGRTNTCNKDNFTLNDLKTMIQLYADDYREEVLEPRNASKTSNSDGPDVQSMYPHDVIRTYINSVYGMTLKPFKKEDNSEE